MIYLKNKTESITIRISLTDKKELERLAAKMNKTPSEFIRFLLKSYLTSIKGVLYENKK